MLHNTKRIVIGHYGYNYLVKKTELTDLVLPKIPFYQIISITFYRIPCFFLAYFGENGYIIY